jgi:hypothetical protein
MIVVLFLMFVFLHKLLSCRRTSTKRALGGCTTEVHHRVGEGECRAEGGVVSINYKIEEIEL